MDLLVPIVGDPNYNIEQLLRRIVTEAIESGIDMQRQVLLVDTDDIETPLRPPPSDVPLPLPPKLPKGL